MLKEDISRCFLNSFFHYFWAK